MKREKKKMEGKIEGKGVRRKKEEERRKKKKEGGRRRKKKEKRITLLEFSANANLSFIVI